MIFTDDEIERYARHLVLAEVGGAGQQRLKRARVMIVGLGGVGGPAALYLAAAGLGRLTVVDPDTVSLSNIQRQIIFDTSDVARLKVEAGAARLTSINPHVEIMAEARPFADVAAQVASHDLVLDGTDDFAVRHAVNRACVAAGVPLVSGALGRWSGQVALFEGRPCYRCLAPEEPADPEVCARTGVVGAIAGVVGAWAALEAIKRLTGAGDALRGRLLILDGLTAGARVVGIQADPECPICG